MSRVESGEGFVDEAHDNGALAALRDAGRHWGPALSLVCNAERLFRGSCQRVIKWKWSSIQRVDSPPDIFTFRICDDLDRANDCYDSDRLAHSSPKRRSSFLKEVES